jgi:hypothetical protein
MRCCNGHDNSLDSYGHLGTIYVATVPHRASVPVQHQGEIIVSLQGIPFINILLTRAMQQGFKKMARM